MSGTSVTAAIPEGSIEIEAADDPMDVRLRLRKDDDRTVMFYYHFRATGLRGRERPGPSKRTCWIMARQHPSESMSSFFVEGFVERMLDTTDPIVSALLDKAVIHVVPNMNPDGTQRAYTRNNAAGRNPEPRLAGSGPGGRARGVPGARRDGANRRRFLH